MTANWSNAFRPSVDVLDDRCLPSAGLSGAAHLVHVRSAHPATVHQLPPPAPHRAAAHHHLRHHHLPGAGGTQHLGHPGLGHNHFVPFAGGAPALGGADFSGSDFLGGVGFSGADFSNVDFGSFDGGCGCGDPGFGGGFDLGASFDIGGGFDMGGGFDSGGFDGVGDSGL
jgi:hypothetical protein